MIAKFIHQSVRGIREPSRVRFTEMVAPVADPAISV